MHNQAWLPGSIARPVEERPVSALISLVCNGSAGIMEFPKQPRSLLRRV